MCSDTYVANSLSSTLACPPSAHITHAHTNTHTHTHMPTHTHTQTHTHTHHTHTHMPTRIRKCIHLLSPICVRSFEPVELPLPRLRHMTLPVCQRKAVRDSFQEALLGVMSKGCTQDKLQTASSSLSHIPLPTISLPWKPTVNCPVLCVLLSPRFYFFCSCCCISGPAEGGFCIHGWPHSSHVNDSCVAAVRTELHHQDQVGLWAVGTLCCSSVCVCVCAYVHASLTSSLRLPLF